jgi:peptidoglycan/xylan/chitin deacetylase (PgdA/CDA1 family)
VALTIDDGPHPVWTPRMLDLLAELAVPATFSLIGVQVTEYPQLVRRIVDSGHQVSDHTVTHPLNLPALTDARVREEIGGAHDRIAQISGVAPKFFRSPGGAWSQRILGVAAEHSMICIDWQVDPRDWARPGTVTITDRLLRAQAGDILLCHDGGGDRSETIRALRTVIPTLKQRGLTFVALTRPSYQRRLRHSAPRASRRTERGPSGWDGTGRLRPQATRVAARLLIAHDHPEVRRRSVAHF